MAARAGTFFSLAVLAASLAAIVPGVFEPARAGASVPPASVLPSPVAQPPAVSPVGTSRPAALSKAAKPLDPFAPRVIVERRRSAIPVGCERLISPLARSASALIGRCIT